MGKAWSKNGPTRAKEEGSNVDPQPRQTAGGGEVTRTSSADKGLACGASGDAAGHASGNMKFEATAGGDEEAVKQKGAEGESLQASGQPQQAPEPEITQDETQESSGEAGGASGNLEHGESILPTPTVETKDTFVSCAMKPKPKRERIAEPQSSTAEPFSASAQWPTTSPSNHEGPTLSPPTTPVRSKPRRSNHHFLAAPTSKPLKSSWHSLTPTSKPSEPSSGGGGHPPPPTSKPPELPPWARMRRKRKTKKANKIPVLRRDPEASNKPGEPEWRVVNVTEQGHGGKRSRPSRRSLMFPPEKSKKKSAEEEFLAEWIKPHQPTRHSISVFGSGAGMRQASPIPADYFTRYGHVRPSLHDLGARKPCDSDTSTSSSDIVDIRREVGPSRPLRAKGAASSRRASAPAQLGFRSSTDLSAGTTTSGSDSDYGDSSPTEAGEKKKKQVNRK